MLAFIRNSPVKKDHLIALLLFTIVTGVLIWSLDTNQGLLQTSQNPTSSSALTAISPLIFGSNLSLNNSSDQFVSTNAPSILSQQVHVQFVRMPIRTIGGISPWEIQAATNIHSMGATALIIFKYSQTNPIAADEQVINAINNIFGNATVYYEFGNERDLNGVNQYQYVGMTSLNQPDPTDYDGWNYVVPQLVAYYKSINPNNNAKFGGPTNFQTNPTYIAYFIKYSNPKPNFISWHEYTCGNTDTAQYCVDHIDNWASHIANTKAAIAAIPDDPNKYPIFITEWNYDPNVQVSDPRYNQPVTDDKFGLGSGPLYQILVEKAIHELEVDGVTGANHYVATNGSQYYNLLDSSNNLTQEGIWYANTYNALMSSNPTPTPTPTLTSTITPTIKPTLTPSPTTAPTVTSTPIVTSGVIAQDTFQRSNQSLWGISSNGQAWSGDANLNKVFSIVNNTGQVKNGSASYDAILGPISSNVQILFTGNMNSFNSSNLGAVLHWQNANNWYKAYIDGVNLVIQKRVSGNYSTLSSMLFSATGNTQYSLRFQVNGSTLSAKVWKSSLAEPANWMLSTTDNTFTSGYSGLRMLIQNSTIATYTSFIISSISTTVMGNVCSNVTTQACGYTSNCSAYPNGTTCERNTSCNSGNSANNIYTCQNGTWVYTKWTPNGSCNFCK